MEIYNIDHIPGREIEAIRLVRGMVVTSKHKCIHVKWEHEEQIWFCNYYQ